MITLKGFGLNTKKLLLIYPDESRITRPYLRHLGGGLGGGERFTKILCHVGQVQFVSGLFFEIATLLGTMKSAVNEK